MRFRLVVTVLGTLLLANQLCAEETQRLKTLNEMMSYIIGIDIGKNLKTLPVDIDPDILVRGINDALVGSEPLLTEQEVREAISLFQMEILAKQEALAEKNKKEGEAFLEENKKKEGVVTLPSGLQYKVIKVGTGKRPKPIDAVIIHYRGTLIDGTEIESSYHFGQPATFTVSEVIMGLTEALGLMQEGAKWQLFMPPNLAYGERGKSDQIGPNVTLIFEVELISILEEK
jgi:FKBP-type peptidyl-prolyl cis-trans isomerase FklB